MKTGVRQCQFRIIKLIKKEKKAGDVIGLDIYFDIHI